MKNIIVFNDISGLGNCSMSANLPIFTALGHYCMPVVTACYSCQTGFGNFTVSPNSQVKQFAQDISANASADAVYVGFCSDVAALKAVKSAVSGVLPKSAYLFVDPIMGDSGKLYPVFDAEYADAMKSAVKGANCISPNLTEACLLAGVDYFELVSHRNEAGFLAKCGETFKDFLQTTGAASAVITGIPCGEYLGNAVLDGKSVNYVTNERTQTEFSGTGDVFSSVLLGEILNGKTLLESALAAAEFVGKSARYTERTDRRFGIDFCKFLDTLK